MTVVHTELTPIRDRKGHIEVVHQVARTETTSEHDAHEAKMRAALKSEASALREELRRVTSERDALRATVNEDHGRISALELLIHTERVRSAGLERDQALLMAAQHKAILEGDACNEAFVTALATVVRAVQSPVSESVYVLPADLVDVPALGVLEQDLREIAAAEDPPRELPAPIRWVLPSDEEAS